MARKREWERKRKRKRESGRETERKRESGRKRVGEREWMNEMKWKGERKIEVDTHWIFQSNTHCSIHLKIFYFLVLRKKEWEKSERKREREDENVSNVSNRFRMWFFDTFHLTERKKNLLSLSLSLSLSVSRSLSPTNFLYFQRQRKARKSGREREIEREGSKKERRKEETQFGRKRIGMCDKNVFRSIPMFTFSFLRTSRYSLSLSLSLSLSNVFGDFSLPCLLFSKQESFDPSSCHHHQVFLCLFLYLSLSLSEFLDHWLFFL